MVWSNPIEMRDKPFLPSLMMAIGFFAALYDMGTSQLHEERWLAWYYFVLTLTGVGVVGSLLYPFIAFDKYLAKLLRFQQVVYAFVFGILACITLFLPEPSHFNAIDTRDICSLFELFLPIGVVLTLSGEKQRIDPNEPLDVGMF